MENKIIVNNQADLNKIDLKYNGEIVIIGGGMNTPIKLTKYYENAIVILSGNAVIEMYGNSQVKEMYGNSQVNYMWENSQVNYMYGNSQVNYMWENSQVKEMWGNGIIKNIGSKSNKVNCYGFNFIFVPNNITNNDIILNETSQIIKFDTFKTKPSVDFYLKHYNVKKKDDNTLIMYKAVHKKSDGIYCADYMEYEYRLGEINEHECSQDNSDSCQIGLHVSDLMFAVRFGRCWNDLAIIEVEVPIKDIVVSIDCDGKVRTSKLTVVRELELDEYKNML